MMIFIFVAGLLVQNMDTRNFLNSPVSSSSLSVDGIEHEGQLREIYLLIMILCYIAFSSLGVMILPWTLSSELFPIEVMTTNC